MINSKHLTRIGFISLESVNHFLKPAFTSLLSLVAIRFSNEAVWGSFVPYLIGIEMLLTILNWGQKPYLIRSFSMHSDNFSASWFTAFWARVVLFLPLLFVVGFIPLFSNQLGFCLWWLVLRFFSQSLEPIIQFQRKYWISILAESLSIISALLVLLYHNQIDIVVLLLGLVSGLVIKSIILIPLIPFNENWLPSKKSIFFYLKSAFPFVLLSVIGLFQAKIDLYVVTLQMNESDIAFYQVLSGFLVMMQTGAFLILAPFQKNIYRINAEAVQSIKRQYFMLGVGITLIGAISIGSILHFLYHFDFSWWIVPLIVLYILPLYLYIIESQILLKAHKENLLLLSTASSAIVGFVICYFTIPIWGLYGALIGGIFARVVIAIMVVYYAKKIA